MKIRAGFVSNSSSTSFMVEAKSPLEVFKKMIRVVEKEYCSYDAGKNYWNECYAPIIKKFLDVYSFDYEGGIIIPFTCNYETFIYPVKDGKCYVETCNNHEWSKKSDMKISNWDDDFMCKHTKDDETMCVDVSTLRVSSPKAFTRRLFAEYGMVLYDDE